MSSLGTLFYLVDPRQHQHAKVEDVPDHINAAIPWFLILIVLEIVASFVDGHAEHGSSLTQAGRC